LERQKRTADPVTTDLLGALLSVRRHVFQPKLIKNWSENTLKLPYHIQYL
jgi:hypothetical protein